MVPREDDLKRKLAVILYADVAGYSRLTGSDEEGTHRILRDYLDLISASIENHNGRVVHYAGDAVLADFGTVVDALNCATEIQSDLKESNRDHPEERRVEFRVGINLGDVIVDKGEIYGDGVNVAARLEGLAEPGGICITEAVRTAIGQKLPLEFVFMGEQQVKNIDQPVRAYRVTSASPLSVHPSESVRLPGKPSIVVLAFDNMSNDTEQEYFSDGISEDIITELSKVAGLFVIARNSAFAYKGKQINVREVSKELGVRYVLEGSVRKVGSRVRISAQLVDGTTGGHIWAEKYDRELTDIFAVQDEVTQEIVTTLAPKLADRQRAVNRPTGDIEAYDYFLRGRQLSLTDTKEASLQARQMLERATELDTGFSLAFAHLARSHVVAYVNRWNKAPEESLQLGLDYAHRAVDLDQSNAFAHFALCTAVVWIRELDRAEAEANKALDIDPNFAEGYAALGFVQVYAGKPEQAIRSLQRCMRLDPHYRDIFLHIIAQAHFQLGQFHDVVVTLKRRLIRKPDSDISRVLLAAAYGHLGELEKSRAEWDEALRINPDYSLEHRRRILPYKNPAHFEHIVEGLRKAGIATS